MQHQPNREKHPAKNAYTTKHEPVTVRNAVSKPEAATIGKAKGGAKRKNWTHHAAIRKRGTTTPVPGDEHPATLAGNSCHSIEPPRRFRLTPALRQQGSDRLPHQGTDLLDASGGVDSPHAPGVRLGDRSEPQVYSFEERPIG